MCEPSKTSDGRHSSPKKGQKTYPVALHQYGQIAHEVSKGSDIYFTLRQYPLDH
jgi:hypothetical protein